MIGQKLNPYRMPRHIAIIMDGNGRWAKKRKMPRTYGHKKGSENLKNIAIACRHLGIEVLSVYAFSTENWKRPKGEVDFLMKLLAKFLKNEISSLKKNNIKFDDDIYEKSIGIKKNNA